MVELIALLTRTNSIQNNLRPAECWSRPNPAVSSGRCGPLISDFSGVSGFCPVSGSLVTPGSLVWVPGPLFQSWSFISLTGKVAADSGGEVSLALLPVPCMGSFP